MPARAPFSTVSGKTLTGVDGSSITLTLIEGGMELQVMPSDGNGSARKTTFTFMTDRMGTVVEDTGAPSAGSSVTGFFRLTPRAWKCAMPMAAPPCCPPMAMAACRWRWTATPAPPAAPGIRPATASATPKRKRR